MKTFITLAMLFLCHTATARILETTCNNQNCFRDGWTTTEPGTDYLLRAKCTNNDCARFGWESVDNRGSSFSVTCRALGCFTTGWTSVENDNGNILFDFVTCKGKSCLTNGWDILSTYDGGGEVACKNNDCSRFGGLSYWRGKFSETYCYEGDCYRFGWAAEIED
jgi:hypothetical protein